MGINLVLGILYTWSVISKGIPDSWNWSEADKSWPYAIACLVFSITMVPAGRLQDRIGPSLVARAGGLLVGLGMILAGLTTSPAGYILGFGVMAGAGMGFGYAAATPAAVKWFPPAKSGLITGVVVSGFGLSPVYAAPLVKWLMAAWGIQNTMLTLGAGCLIIIAGFRPVPALIPGGLAQMLDQPHKNHVSEPEATETKRPGHVGAWGDSSPLEMLRTAQFYMLWFTYACAAGAGLMVIGKLAVIARHQAGLELGFLLVVVLAAGNGGGRIVAGVVSDKVGRKTTMFICFLLQTVLVILLSRVKRGSFFAYAPVMAVISALIGANYGANMSLFPSITKDYYGLKNFGMNFGLIFTAWGTGGLALALLAGRMYDVTGSFDVAYYGAAALLIPASIVVLCFKPPKPQANDE